MLQKFAGHLVGAPFLWGPLFGRTCWTCLNPPLAVTFIRRFFHCPPCSGVLNLLHCPLCSAVDFTVMFSSSLTGYWAGGSEPVYREWDVFSFWNELWMKKSKEIHPKERIGGWVGLNTLLATCSRLLPVETLIIMYWPIIYLFMCFIFISCLIGSRPSDHYFRSVCWFVCLFVQSFSQPSLIQFWWNLDIRYMSGSSCVP